MIKVLLFAGLKERTGKSQIPWDKAPITVKNLKAELAAVPGLENLSGIAVAVNEAFAPDDTVIQDGDTVAFIPPVSGG